MTFESEGLLIVGIYIWLPPASYDVFPTTLVVLSVTLSLCGQKNFNLGHNFWPVWGMNFIFHMYIPCEGPFHPYKKFWPSDIDCDLWPTYLKTLTLTITFEPFQVGLSHAHSLWWGLSIHTNIVMPLAWKVRRGHLVIGLSVCLSVIPSRLQSQIIKVWVMIQ